MQHEDTNTMVTIEKNKRLSESSLWQMQKDYYTSAGINAWVDQIPFEVTCNPFIANSYAHIAVAFIRDYLHQHPDAAQHPFYFIELGTGSGKFSFYALKSILELLNLAGMNEIKIKYIMSDFTEHNIQYYKAHPGLKPYIDKNIIDFALFELESDKPITLQLAKTVLTNKIVKNPIIAFANYVFDTTSHDAFYIHDKQVQPLLVNITSPQDNINDGKIKEMDKLNISFLATDDQAAYPDKIINLLLEDYRNTITHSNILIPVGALKAITHLRKVANNQMMLISTDKGNSSIDSLENLGPPGITFHASTCFSLMVNYHALANYFKLLHGDAFLETSRDKTLETAVCFSGFKLAELPETHIAIEHYIDETSPCDYYKIDKHIRETFENCDLDTLTTHLSLSHWNPTIYSIISSRIESLIPGYEGDALGFLSKNMPKLAANYYYMPKSDSTLFQVGLYFHLLKQYDEAIHYYTSALAYDKSLFYIHYNLGLCYHAKQDQQQALTHLESALKMDPDSIETKNLIASIREKQA